MRSLIVIAALALSVTTATADATGIEPGFMTCNRGGCEWGNLPSGEPRIIHVQPRQPESEASVRAWYARCHPRIYVDELGVERYRYAAAGCDLGPR